MRKRQQPNTVGAREHSMHARAKPQRGPGQPFVSPGPHVSGTEPQVTPPLRHSRRHCRPGPTTNRHSARRICISPSSRTRVTRGQRLAAPCPQRSDDREATEIGKQATQKSEHPARTTSMAAP
ncbi:hypothetical protein SETIT_9G073600v2 [Setaria italica]|uniref:Uncharacterized protein n=1 Tax=Setaria italica TaxID=4555 RepID=A0A368SE01_SETIT|nr:hypothetical protein SETIT_9G073600v2 [Setaria italica]